MELGVHAVQPHMPTSHHPASSLLLCSQGAWASARPLTATLLVPYVVDLASVLTPEIMAPILANADVQERLLPYLPSGESLPQTAEEIQNTLTSPQFQQVCMDGVHGALCTCDF